jgi:hypothetical protein
LVGSQNFIFDEKNGLDQQLALWRRATEILPELGEAPAFV